MIKKIILGFILSILYFGINQVSASFSGQFLYLNSSDNSLSLYDNTIFYNISNLSLSDYCISSDNSKLGLVSTNGELYIQDVILPSLNNANLVVSTGVGKCSFSSDNTKIFFISNGGTQLGIYDLTSNSLTYKSSLNYISTTTASLPFYGYWGGNITDIFENSSSDVGICGYTYNSWRGKYSYVCGPFSISSNTIFSRSQPSSPYLYKLPNAGFFTSIISQYGIPYYSNYVFGFGAGNTDGSSQYSFCSDGNCLLYDVDNVINYQIGTNFNYTGNTPISLINGAKKPFVLSGSILLPDSSNCITTPINFPFLNSYTYFNHSGSILENKSIVNGYYFEYSPYSNNNSISYILQHSKNIENFTGSIFSGTGYLKFDSLWNPLDPDPYIEIESYTTFDYFIVNGQGNQMKLFDNNGYVQDLEYNKKYTISSNYLRIEFESSLLTSNEVYIDYGSKEQQMVDSIVCKLEDGNSTINGNFHTGAIVDYTFDTTGTTPVSTLNTPNNISAGFTGTVNISNTYGPNTFGANYSSCDMFSPEGFFLFNGNSNSILDFRLSNLSDNYLVKQVVYYPDLLLSFVLVPLNNGISLLRVIGPNNEGKYCYMGTVQEIQYQKLLSIGTPLFTGLNTINVGYMLVIDYLFLFFFGLPILFLIFYSLKD